MTPYLKLNSDEVAPLRAHYQGVAHDVLHALWRRKLLIALFAVAGIVSALAAIVVLPPRYTSEAILQVNFNRDEPNTTTKSERIASIEAAAVVEGAARILRSRTLASAVVTRLGLATDPAFTRPSRLMRAIWWARASLGLPVVIPTPHDIAADRLSSALQVNIVPRSYVISIAISAATPERAAQLPNAVVFEYLRSQRVQQLLDLNRTLARDLADIAAIYGEHHPRTVDVKEKLQDLHARLSALRTMDLTAGSVSADGSALLLPAEPVMTPSGPNIPIVIAFILGLALLACGGLIALLEFRAPASYRVKFPATPIGGEKSLPVAAVHSQASDSSTARWLA